MFSADDNVIFINKLTGKRLLEKQEDLTKVVVYILDQSNLPSQIGIYVSNDKIVTYQKTEQLFPQRKVIFHMQRICGTAIYNLQLNTYIRIMNVSSFMQNFLHLN